MVRVCCHVSKRPREDAALPSPRQEQVPRCNFSNMVDEWPKQSFLLRQEDEELGAYLSPGKRPTKLMISSGLENKH